MYDRTAREAAVSMLNAGASLRSVSIRTGIARDTLRTWRDRGITPKQPRADCPFCNDKPFPPTSAYLYLLGLYLGDGCISRGGRTFAMRIACCNGWPGLIEECERTMRSVSNGRPAYRVQMVGATSVVTLWNHWPCLFPQHGRGRKHDRAIVLQPWQLAMVESDPRPMIRGLLHSDGWRGTNWTEKLVAGVRKRFEYPRYLFTNRSQDIRDIFTDSLDRVGIAWRYNNTESVSIARREAVAALDEFVGPKY
jgi:hypothetical protein